MTRRHKLDNRHHMLSEIRNIMSSMKTLAILETHKLERFIEAHNNMANSIELISDDFLQFHQQVIPTVTPDTEVICLIGSEHGFCGDFNEQITTAFKQLYANKTDNQPIVIGIGNKLLPLLADQHSKVASLAGADIAEEIFTVVESLTEQLASHPQPSSLYVIHHDHQDNGVKTEQLLPPFQGEHRHLSKHSTPPLLNLSPKDFFIELTDHYLFSALHRIFYNSLMIENQRRIQHLENALHHIDDKTEELLRKINILRQEEIIEEIEVILLNAASD